MTTDMYKAAKAKSSEKGFVAQPLTLALELLKHPDYLEGFSDHDVDDLLIETSSGGYVAYQVKNVLGASLSSLAASDYERIRENVKNGYKTIILLVDESEKMQTPEYEVMDIKKLDPKSKYSDLHGITTVIKTNNITAQFSKSFDDSFSMEAVFAAIGVSIFKTFNDGTVKREEMIDIMKSLSIKDVKKAIKTIMNGNYGNIISEEYGKNLSFFKYLDNLKNILDEDAEDQYMLYINLKIVMNNLIGKGYYTLEDFESKMRTLKGEYVLTKAVENPENMYKFLNHNTFTFPLLSDDTETNFKVGAAIYWAEVKDKYDFTK